MSRKVIFVDCSKKDDRVCLSKPYEEIECKDDDDKDLFYASVHDKYSARPTTLEHLCLAEFATSYRSLSQQRIPDHLHDNDADDDDFSNEPGSVIKLQDGLGFLCKRQQPAILRYHRFNKQKEEDKYFYSKQLLYLPWRNEDREIVNCKEMFKINRITIVENESKFNVCGQAIDSALDILANGNIEEMWNDLEPATLQQAGENLESNIADEDIQSNTNIIVHDKLSAVTDTNFSVDNQPDEMNESDYSELMNSLNAEQKEIVAEITQWCEEVVKRNVARESPPAPFYKFVSGPGGVGKSHVINAVYESCRRLVKCVHTHDPDASTVLLTAPTGVAAYNIGGMTLHSAFLLNTHHGYQSLSGERQQTMHNKLKHLRVLIIDEISMVGSQTLFDIHRRLKEIMNRSDYDDSIFGGVSVMAVGDLYQLQPVKQKYVFELPTELSGQLFGCLWNNFDLTELKVSMRQQNDQNFSDLLTRIRTASYTANDIEQLTARVIQDENNYPSEALHVFATNSKTDDYNNYKLNDLPGPHYTVTATDSKTDQQTGQITVSMPKKASETGGLKESLVLAIGARVMLTSNLDIVDGLVNGARGEIADFEFYADGNVKTVFVKFDNCKVGRRAAEKKKQWSGSTY